MGIDDGVVVNASVVAKANGRVQVTVVAAVHHALKDVDGFWKKKENLIKTKLKDSYTVVQSYYGSNMSLFSSSLKVKKRNYNQFYPFSVLPTASKTIAELNRLSEDLLISSKL